MFRTVLQALSIAALILTASCAPDQPASTTASSQSLSASPTKSTSTATATSDMPIPPKGALYTIYCQSISGPGHIDESRLLRQSLMQGTKMKDWYVIHGNNKSTLYYGFYRTVDPRDPADGAEGKRAIADLDSIRAMTDSSGYRPFSTSLPVPIDTPDPTANPAWDLARSGGYYSLQIAVYKDSPNRKEAAVEAVREARAQGIEAYYYHGPVASSVCIGAWPKEAAQETDTAQENTDPNTPLLVTPVPLPESMVKQWSDVGVKAVAPTLTPLDPNMLQMMDRFRTFAVNGEVLMRRGNDPKTGEPVRVPAPSFLVKVPHQEATDDVAGPMVSGDSAGGAPTADNTTGLPAASAQPQQDSSVGQLKSLGN